MLTNLVLLGTFIGLQLAPDMIAPIVATKAYTKHEEVVLEVYREPDAVLTGWLSGFAWEPHKYTMEYRLLQNHVQWGADAYIATGSCEYVGWTGVMCYRDLDLCLDVQVFDCSGKWDGGVVDGKSVLSEAGYAAELDWASWNTYPHGKVEIELFNTVGE